MLRASPFQSGRYCPVSDVAAQFSLDFFLRFDAVRGRGDLSRSRPRQTLRILRLPTRTPQGSQWQTGYYRAL